MPDMSTSLSPLGGPGDWRYRPCLPQRGPTSEPHYSVPRNNARVEVAGWTNNTTSEMDKTPTNEAGRMLETLEKVVRNQHLIFFHFRNVKGFMTDRKKKCFVCSETN